MPEQPIEVFISYRWMPPSIEIADKIQRVLSADPYNFKVLRDNTEVRYKGSIKDYMERLGNGSAVILILSDGYMKSRHCMYELVTLNSHKDFFNRIYPIVLEDADIHKEAGRLRYKQFWGKEKKELQQVYDETEDKSHTENSVRELSLYDTIQDSVSRIISIIDEMNTLSRNAHVESDFEAIGKAILQDAMNNLNTGSPSPGNVPPNPAGLNNPPPPMTVPPHLQPPPVNPNQHFVLRCNFFDGGTTFVSTDNLIVFVNPLTQEMAPIGQKQVSMDPRFAWIYAAPMGNYGVDFHGGIWTENAFGQPVQIGQVSAV